MKLLEFRSFKLDKKRVQVFEQKISNVATIRNSNISMKSMSLLKDMISDATIISQFDAKIIMINAGGSSGIDFEYKFPILQLATKLLHLTFLCIIDPACR